jgi:hypothetical protein
MEEERRVRSHALYCEARKLSATLGLSLADFDREQRRLKREYADVFTDLAGDMMRQARTQLKRD